ncbi:hypothetical protein B0H19DRAFT_1244125 [Mycena capillaripes]|nr:hypothetical protein B0H19DRAFT_1244125 [Mycena capillaripes]
MPATYDALPTHDDPSSDPSAYLLPTDTSEEDGYPPTAAAAHRYSRKPPRWRRPLVWAGMGAVFVVLAYMAFAPRAPPPPRHSTWQPAWQPAPEGRVYLRVGRLGAEGFGSALQHFKQSIALSTALNTTLLLAAEKSEHAYSTSAIYNGARPAAPIDALNACRMKDHLPQGERAALVRGWCAGDAAALAQVERLRADMTECTGILDVDENETTEDLNGCVQSWIRTRLAPLHPPPLPPPLTIPPTRPITVGVHIRWGDTAPGDQKVPDPLPTTFRGSMSVANMKRVLGDLRDQFGSVNGVGGGEMKVTIAMENAFPPIIAQLASVLPAAGYEVLDSGDAVADLHALAAHDFLLLGESSWGVLVHLVAGKGVSVVELSNGGKYKNTTGFDRRVLFIDGPAGDGVGGGGAGEGMEEYSAAGLGVGWGVPEGSPHSQPAHPAPPAPPVPPGNGELTEGIAHGELEADIAAHPHAPRPSGLASASASAPAAVEAVGELEGQGEADE